MRRAHGLVAQGVDAQAVVSSVEKKRELLLIPHMEIGLSYKPDRTVAVASLRRNGFEMANRTTNEEFLRNIARHKFTLAPFGRGT